MGNLDISQERKIMPQHLFEHYVMARSHTFASEKEALLGLNIPGLMGYRYPEEPLVDNPFIYEDNYNDDVSRPGNFAGFELNRDRAKGKEYTLYVYAGGLTKEGLELGEKVVYSILSIFLKAHAAEVRFGKKVIFTIKDGEDIWVYEGDGEVKPWGWEDNETIKRNDTLLYELNGNGVCFIKGF